MFLIQVIIYLHLHLHIKLAGIHGLQRIVDYHIVCKQLVRNQNGLLVVKPDRGPQEIKSSDRPFITVAPVEVRSSTVSPGMMGLVSTYMDKYQT